MGREKGGRRKGGKEERRVAKIYEWQESVFVCEFKRRRRTRRKKRKKGKKGSE